MPWQRKKYIECFVFYWSVRIVEYEWLENWLPTLTDNHKINIVVFIVINFMSRNKNAQVGLIQFLHNIISLIKSRQTTRHAKAK